MSNTKGPGFDDQGNKVVVAGGSQNQNGAIALDRARSLLSGLK